MVAFDTEKLHKAVTAELTRVKEHHAREIAAIKEQHARELAALCEEIALLRRLASPQPAAGNQAAP